MISLFSNNKVLEIMSSDEWASLDSDQRIAVLRHEYRHMQYCKIPIDTSHLMTHDEVNSLLNELDTVLEKKCECGKDGHGFMFHSTWCPKWERV